MVLPHRCYLQVTKGYEMRTVKGNRRGEYGNKSKKCNGINQKKKFIS